MALEVSWSSDELCRYMFFLHHKSLDRGVCWDRALLIKKQMYTESLSDDMIDQNKDNFHHLYCTALFLECCRLCNELLSFYIELVGFAYDLTARYTHL